MQKTYRLQGVDINDKHIEVIIKQMMRKVRILSPGISEFVGGSCVEKDELLKEIKKLKENGATKTAQQKLSCQLLNRCFKNYKSIFSNR